MSKKSLPPSAALLFTALMAGAVHARAQSVAYTGPLATIRTLPPADPTVSGVRARFFGVSTVMLTDGQTNLMVDGFFSRPGWFKLAAAFAGVKTLRPDTDRVATVLRREGIATLDALFVTHTHHDHAMDSAFVAGTTGAKLYGSQNMKLVAKGQHVDLIDPPTPIEEGRFTIVAKEQKHAQTPFQANGPMPASLELPTDLNGYKSDANYSFLVSHAQGCILIVPSADHLEYEFKDVKADVVLLGIGGLGKKSRTEIEAFWERIVQPTGARLVVPIHWDDFARPYELGLAPLPIGADNIAKSLAVLRQLAEKRQVELALLPPSTSVLLPQARGAACGSKPS